MGYSSDSERPAKRIKHSQPYQRQSWVSSSTSPTSTGPSVMPSDSVFDTWMPPTASGDLSTGPSSLSLPPQTWQPTSFELPPSHLFYPFPLDDSQDSWKAPLPSATIAPPESGRDSSTTTTSHHPQHTQEVRSSLVVPTTNSDPANLGVRTVAKDRRNSSSSKGVAPQLVSPFHDCLDQFGTFTRLEFRRPNDGFVNGYVKFRWANKSSQPPGNPQQVPVPVDPNAWTAVPPVPGAVPGTTPGAPMPGGSVLSPVTPVTTDFSNADVAGLSPARNEWSSFSSAPSPDLLPQDSGGMAVQASNPRMLPPQFGFQAKMETSTDRKFWEFYIKNWCPGRSILRTTNLWLNDFARMHENEGVRAAIQCLAGVYIYDYVPQPNISKRVNELFGVAERRLTALLNDRDSLQADQGSELITIAVILSMQDIVLTERRRKKPNPPRWLEGFLQSEFALQLTDPGSRFWRSNNIQLTSLRVSQSIIVGRAVILAQPMMPLPAPKDFDTKKEASRFGWLLYGTEQDMYEIHGGCGFSKKLLHVLSQITYCTARLQQDGESPVAPLTAKFLLKELQEMRQWSSESRPWDLAKSSHQTIDWVRTMPDTYIIDTSEAMTDVTAEAWRLAALVYLQCRALRLPRNHAEVLVYLEDLASCIRIMPTSGHHFTAQAPLFPVFLLGMTATDPRHKQVSRYWFEQVVQTPVRSSVPPLFETLQGIWSWIDDEIPLDHQQPPESVALRDPWWEHLVERVGRKENETLCLT